MRRSPAPSRFHHLKVFVMMDVSNEWDGSPSLTEASIADKLEEFRRAQEKFVSLRYDD